MKINQKLLQTGTPNNGKKYKAWDTHPNDSNYLFYSYIRRKDGSQYERWTTRDVYLERKKYLEGYCSKNRKLLNEKSKGNYQKNLEYYSDYGKKWKKENREKCREYALKTYYKYPEKSKLNTVVNRFKNINLSKLQKKEIESIYLLRAELDLCAKGAGSSKKFHVDHIMPLNHEKFTGLHAPWNLQILTASENCRKRNKIDNNY